MRSFIGLMMCSVLACTGAPAIAAPEPVEPGSALHGAAMEAAGRGEALGDVDRGITIPGNGADTCAGAPSLFGLGAYSFNLAGATTDGLTHPACLAFGTDQIWRDRWWRFVSPVTGTVTISTCSQTSADTRIAVYSPAAPCAPTSEYVIVCNDDACNTQTTVSFIASAGQSYLVRLGLYGQFEPGAAGSGTFTISSNAAPVVCDADGPCQNPVSANNAYTSTNALFRVADNFVPNASGGIVGLCWWGSYSGDNVAEPDLFVVTYWTNSGGAPGRPIASFTQNAGLALERVDSGMVDIVGSRMFQYSARHADVPVADSTPYWVEVTNRFGGTWFWQASSNGNGALQDSSPPSNWTGSTAIPNLAFCLDFRSACDFDTDGDGDIDFGDLNNIVSNFNTSCP